MALSAMRRVSRVILDTLLAQAFDLGHQRMRIKHDAIADDAEACFLRTTPPEGRSESL